MAKHKLARFAEGYWVNNQRDGNFVRTQKNGTKLRATYSKGKLITDWH